MTSLIALFLCIASAAPTVTVRATVSADLRSIRGTLQVEDLPGVVWRDVLADLPSATGDLDSVRMWPIHPNHGQVTWVEEGDTLTFETRMPHRWGDVGWSRRGLFANGGWYPVGLVDGELPLVHWDVEVAVPDDVVGVVGDVAAPRLVRWAGDGERASLAAIADARATPYRGDGYDVLLLTKGPPRRALDATLRRQLAVMAVHGTTWRGVIVEAPMRLHLARAGLGLAYLSDLAFEVFPGFARLHAEDVAKGLAEAFTPSEDPLTRAIAGAAMGYRQRIAIGAEHQGDSLLRARWLSIVDNALRSSDMRFQDAILQEPALTRPISDDLVERFRPHVPAAVAIGQVRARVGATAAIELGSRLARGVSLPEAACEVGLAFDPVEAWSGSYPLRDYAVTKTHGQITVSRDAPPEAAPEVVVVEVEGERTLWEVPRGPASLVITDPNVRKVVVDPDHMVGQTTRTNDQVPVPVFVVAGALLGRVNFLQQFVEAALTLSLRRSADTHNRFLVGVFSNQRDRIGATAGWTGLFGPPTLRTVREHALDVFLEFSLLNPVFDRSPETRMSVGGGATWSWDDRETILFPRQGASFRLTVSGGGAPQGGNAYIRATALATATYAPHPRVILAGRAVVGVADAVAPARRLVFGGLEGVRALPDQLVQPNAQGIVSIEVRPVLFEHANVPLGVGTMSTLYALAGLDFGAASLAGEPALAIGATVGVGSVFSVLGITPGSVHATVGIPVSTYGLESYQTGFPVTFTASWGVPF